MRGNLVMAPSIASGRPSGTRTPCNAHAPARGSRKSARGRHAQENKNTVADDRSGKNSGRILSPRCLPLNLRTDQASEGGGARTVVYLLRPKHPGEIRMRRPRHGTRAARSGTECCAEGCATLPPPTASLPRRNSMESWNRGVYKCNTSSTEPVAKPHARTYGVRVARSRRARGSNLWPNFRTSVP